MPLNRRRLAQVATTAVTAAVVTAPALASPVLAVAPSTPVAARAAATPGAVGIGDPYFPDYGNGGYNVSSYDIRVNYRPTGDRLRGVTTIRARATQALSRFNLDLALKPSKVTVNGTRARISHRNGHELVVTPRRSLAAGSAMKVVVSYAGVPSKTKLKGITPWTRGNGGALAVGEPEIAAWWFPSNDHPRDKARFTVQVTVPKGLEVLSNGRLLSHRTKGSSTTWRWRASTPMATYLAYFAAGQYSVTKTRAGGRPFVWAVPTAKSAARTRAAVDLRRTPQIVAWGSRQFGPYPFDEIGGVATSAPLGYALETQTRPIYDLDFWQDGANPYVVVHENAHQWFGDSVSVRNWRDIWLNEGFATYAEWLWAEQQQGIKAQSILVDYLEQFPAGNEFWKLRIGNPGASRVFDGRVYDRGAMAVQALRNRIGDRAFFTLLRTWPAQHRNGTADIASFIAYAERVSGQQLDSFFTAWLYTTTRPAATAANGLAGLTSRRTSAADRTRVAALRDQLDRTHELLAHR